jgi:hypothetical protein
MVVATKISASTEVFRSKSDHFSLSRLKYLRLLLLIVVFFFQDLVGLMIALKVFAIQEFLDFILIVEE